MYANNREVTLYLYESTDHIVIPPQPESLRERRILARFADKMTLALHILKVYTGNSMKR